MTITVVAEPDDFRVYKRSSNTGGTFGKGQSLDPEFNVTITGTLLEYRLLDEDGVTPIGAGTWISAGGGGTFNVTTPANNQWYRLELREDGAGNQVTTNKYSCGGITGFAGQSLAARLVKNLGDPSTIADQGITIGDYGVVYATYVESVSKPTATWALPADASDYDSVFCAQYLNDKVAQEQVTWAMAGHAEGGETIQFFVPNEGAGNVALDAILQVTGFEDFIWFQGHSNSSESFFTFDKNQYGYYLDKLYEYLQTITPSFDMTLLPIPNISSLDWGDLEQINRIRDAQKEWAATNSQSAIVPTDIPLWDGVHQDQIGNFNLAVNIFRSQYTTNEGPTLSSINRTGANLTLNFSFPAGSTALVETGSGVDYIDVALASDPWTVLAKSSATVNATTIDLVLSADPGTDDLVVYFGEHNSVDGANIVRDNNISDGFAFGRTIQPTIPASTLLTPNQDLSATGSFVAGRFNQALDGYADNVDGFVAGVGMDVGKDWTVNMFVQNTTDTDLIVFFKKGNTLGNRLWIGSDGGFLAANVQYQDLSGEEEIRPTTTRIDDGAWHEIEVSSDSTTNTIRLFIDGVLETSVVVNAYDGFGTGPFSIGSFGGGAFPWTGNVDDIGVFNTVRNTSNYTSRTSSFAGNEAGLVGLWRMDGNADAAVISPPPSITQINGTIAPGQTIEIVSDNIGVITSVTYGALTIPIDSATQDSTFVTLPDQLALERGIAHTLEIDDGVDTASSEEVLNSRAGWTFSNRSGAAPGGSDNMQDICTNQLGFTPIDGDQLIYTTQNNTVFDAQWVVTEDTTPSIGRFQVLRTNGALLDERIYTSNTDGLFLAINNNNSRRRG